MFKLYNDYKRYKEVADKVYSVAGLIAACKYVINTANNAKIYIPSDVVNSFKWAESPEGWDYWNTISKKLGSWGEDE